MSPLHDLAKLLYSYNPDLPMAPGMKKEFLELRVVIDNLPPEQPGTGFQQAIGRGVRQTVVNRAHNHYFKDVSALTHIDVYRVLQLFNVTDPCIQHAVKKLLVAGGRGAAKDISRDISEACDSLQRWQEMRSEEPVEPSRDSLQP